jgi:hypothetical protein
VNALFTRARVRVRVRLRVRVRVRVHMRGSGSGSGRVSVRVRVCGCVWAHLQEIADHHWSKHVELEVALHTTRGHRHVVAHDLTTHHRKRFTLRWVHLRRKGGSK